MAGLFLIIILLCDTAQNKKSFLLSEYKERIFYLNQHTHTHTHTMRKGDILFKNRYNKVSTWAVWLPYISFLAGTKQFSFLNWSENKYLMWYEIIKLVKQPVFLWLISALKVCSMFWMRNGNFIEMLCNYHCNNFS